MKISFTPLTTIDVENVVQWLQQPHVMQVWDPTCHFMPELIQESQGGYIRDHKRIRAFIIYYNNIPIGYIQYFNAYDFPKDGHELNSLPASLATIEMFIGDKNYLGKGIESKSLTLFLDNQVYKEFYYAMTYSDIANLAAINHYEDTGFMLLDIIKRKVIMIIRQRLARLSVLDFIELERSFKQHWLSNDSLWIFGSRANLEKKGGDIDLYIETHAETIEQAYEIKQNFIADIINAIGDQKIDIVLNMVHYPKKLKIYDVARNEGVKVI